MTRVRLAPRAEDEATVTLVGTAAFPPGPLRLRYQTRTGALLRVDGVVRGAFDGKHVTIELPPLPGQHEIALEVERRGLPISGLPAGDGARWRWMLARAVERPQDHLEVVSADGSPHPRDVDVPLVGHAHLDVAWLWTYDETKRKALRTFATALRELERDERFVFAQSQPQLYAWVRTGDRALFDRIKARIGAGWDASVAPLWVEPDMHAPSGESVLRQFAHGIRWTREHLGIEPTVAWLPDSFGFPATFPTLAAHAGVRSFATTKLEWNERTRWPYPQFRWLGEDGSALTAAVIAGYDGEANERRIAVARDRRELLIHGYGDGGGGVTDEDLDAVAPDARPWTTVDGWFAEVERSALPEYRGELYLETHRGTYTTHHDMKARNAELERALDHAEELAAWCVAVRAPEAIRRALGDDLRSAWQIVLRAQFHDVLPGTSIPSVYVDAHGEYDRAGAIVTRVAEAARSVLPRTDLRVIPPPPIAPRRDGELWIFANAYVRAAVRDDGTILELGAADGPNLVALANGIAAYVDRPKRWDAWNVDADYTKRRVKVTPAGASVDDGALVVHFDVGKGSRIAMRIALLEDEPWLRIELAVAWHEDHVLLRAEHRVALPARGVRYGQQHGTLVREAYPQSEAERAKFEVPGQRWAHVTDGGDGLAVFVTDLYGWSGVGLPDGGIRLGTSLLRSPTWPDPTADRGEQRLAYALVPTAGASISALEQAWQTYASEQRVRLFTCEDQSVLIVATYPSDDGGGVIVRVRECDGEARRVALRCGGRMREAIAVDAAERPVPGDATIAEEELLFDLRPFALRSFLVRF
ncbi:MAG TPA: glycoside hydrolase family 38 C-terminal domain-containing protein [Candidatus Acidoferrum sp.]|nr:glycoside hydrolase family 38 C-terminal domain-containing protein [Candidatus Acidoferrum sp.]